jgi:hypothetical protein
MTAPPTAKSCRVAQRVYCRRLCRAWQVLRYQLPLVRMITANALGGILVIRAVLALNPLASLDTARATSSV